MAEFKTLQFPNTAKGQAQKNRALANHTDSGWSVVSETLEPGKFKGGEACCLGVSGMACCGPIGAMLGFTAGQTVGIIRVMLSKEAQAVGYTQPAMMGEKPAVYAQPMPQPAPRTKLPTMVIVLAIGSAFLVGGCCILPFIGALVSPPRERPEVVGGDPVAPRAQANHGDPGSSPEGLTDTADETTSDAVNDASDGPPVQSPETAGSLPEHKFHAASFGRRSQLRAIVHVYPLPEVQWKRIAVDLSEKYAGSADQILVAFFDDASVIDGWDGSGSLADTDWPHWLCRVATDKIDGRFEATSFKIAPSTDGVDDRVGVVPGIPQVARPISRPPTREWTAAKENLARELYNERKAEYDENIAKIRRDGVMEHEFLKFSTFEKWKKSNRSFVEEEFLRRRPAPPRPVAEPPKYRTWRSADGKYVVEAKFVKFIAGNVFLERMDNGQEIIVPLNKLSAEDAEYLDTRK